MKAKKKKLEDMTREELLIEKQKIDKLRAKFDAAEQANINGEVEQEDYKTNLIYNFFNFFIGGDNSANIKNKQEGKPGGGTPPPY